MGVCSQEMIAWVHLDELVLLQTGICARMFKKRELSSLILLVFFGIFLCLVGNASGGRMLVQSPSSSQGSACPLDFSVLKKYPSIAQQAKGNDVDLQCLTLLAGLQMLLSEYLRTTHYFLVPPEAAQTCLDDYTTELHSEGVNVNFASLCAFPSTHIARGSNNCQNVQQVSDLIKIVPNVTLVSEYKNCNGMLDDDASGSNPLCSACITAVSGVTQALIGYSNASQVGCRNYSSMYAAGIVNSAGPLAAETASCLFGIAPEGSREKSLTVVFVAVGAIAIGILSLGVVLGFYFKRKKQQLEEQRAFIKRNVALLEGSMREGGGSLMFSIEDIKAATQNFARENIIGSGAFGNVYKGVLRTGLEVAVKRFKNCSPAGDKEFVHEVEMISSVRHRNLVVLRGCCIASSGVAEGHQRIIVYDYLPNGSLQDYLFKSKTPSLDWPTRQKIAIGTARGIDYLHHGVKPSILHRDIKGSNILLDAHFNACVADFGLARFTPEGVTHISTRGAGTFGYVAPEYALYGQLTERSDVYSFGVVLLELISGRKALQNVEDFVLITDWAWALVKDGKWREVLDPKMDNRGLDEDMERFVMLALLCGHPQMECRPTITTALKILENDQKLPSIPDRPMPLTVERREIEMTFGSSSKLFSDSGFQSFTSSSEGNIPPVGGR